MKRCIASTLALYLLVMLVGCARGVGITTNTAVQGTLTNSMAEQTINRWMPGCNAKVTGIQEVPQENVAIVNVRFSNVHFTRTEMVFDDQRKGFYEGPVPKTYSGPGIANFTHYNDGRWVMTKVVTSQGDKSTHWDGLSVEAH
jgi:hypothetical protein